MANEWKEKKLVQLGRIVTGKTPPSGIEGYFAGTIPFVTPTDLDGRRIVHSTRRNLTERGADTIAGSRIPACAVMVSCIGSDMGKVAVAAEESVTNQQINSIVVDAANDPFFIYYSLSGRKAELQAIASGSAQPILNKSAFGQIDILLPELREQHTIAHILGTLDDKIELNRRMNETLEAMARALFKSWFVDFDPVKAKAEGRGYDFSSQLSNIFPDCFEQSTMGNIPLGWRATSWGTVVSLEYGKSLSGYAGSEHLYPVFGTNGKIGSFTKPLCNHAGIIVGRKGAYRGIHFCNTPFFVIDTAFYVEPRGAIELRWAYYELLRNDINSMDSGSAIPSTSREDFYNLPVVVPSLDVQEAFARILEPFWLRQESNDRESHTLASLRDTLLPKLISGQLRVKVAEKIVEAVA